MRVTATMRAPVCCSRFGETLATPGDGQHALDKTDRSGRVGPLRDGAGREELADHLLGRPGDRRDRRNAEPLIDLGTARIVDTGHDRRDLVGLPCDARGEDVRVVAARYRRERAFRRQLHRERSRSKPAPTTSIPPQPVGRRRNAEGFLSMTPTVWPIANEPRAARRAPTRPQPTMTTCIRHYATRRGRRWHNLRWSVVLRRAAKLGCSRSYVGRLRPMSSASRSRTSSGSAPEGRPIPLPESLSYRLKRRLLGPPLVTERLAHERLANPIALGVLAPDCISSTAYGSEEILTELVPAVGVAAFALLLPITFAVLAVLIFVTLSYREVVMAYTKAGGAYVVARENFGVADRADCCCCADHRLHRHGRRANRGRHRRRHLCVPRAVAVQRRDRDRRRRLDLAYGNLRGIKEAGRTFALPTYLFVAATGLVIIIGVIRTGTRELCTTHPIHLLGAVPSGTPGERLVARSELVRRAALIRQRWLVAHRSGGDLEWGRDVSSTRGPQCSTRARHHVVRARHAWCSACRFSPGRPTPSHSLGKPDGALPRSGATSLGPRCIGRIGYYVVQGATMLILYTGANTSFNGFPNLASFVAKDAFLPRQLTKRGHRLVFSNGIMFLAVIAIALLLVSRAKVSSLVAVYAIGVFTGFTMAGAGMVRYHLRIAARGWQHRLVINGFAALLSGIVVVIFAVTKFTEGAWVVVVLFPILVAVLIRLHHRYTEEQEELEGNVQRAAEAPVLRRHVVLVFVERLDLAVARALQYAASFSTDELRAVHFVLDTAAADDLEDQWTRVGLIDRVSARNRRVS